MATFRRFFLHTAILASIACGPQVPATAPLETYLRVRNTYDRLCWADCGAVSVEEDEGNALASLWVLEKGSDVLAYNPIEMRRIGETYGNGAVFGILAHEYGHHLDFSMVPPQRPFPLSPEESWVRELHADRWAGCAMATAGEPLRPFVLFLLRECAEETSTHPPGRRRRVETEEGHRACHR